MPRVPVSSQVDPTELRDIAERALTARQYEIWETRIKTGWPAHRIATFLRYSLRTVEREIAAIKAAAEAIEVDKQEGRVRLGHTIAFGHEAHWGPDATLQKVARRQGKRDLRRGA